jgi:Fe-S cluster biogenesis protein NfuA
MDELVRNRVQAALDDIRPQIQGDGGDVELVAVEDDGVVKVRLVGHCAGCPMAQMTLKNGIEAHVRACVPEIQRVESV